MSRQKLIDRISGRLGRYTIREYKASRKDVEKRVSYVLQEFQCNPSDSCENIKIRNSFDGMGVVVNLEDEFDMEISYDDMAKLRMDDEHLFEGDESILPMSEIVDYIICKKY